VSNENPGGRFFGKINLLNQNSVMLMLPFDCHNHIQLGEWDTGSVTIVPPSPIQSQHQNKDADIYHFIRESVPNCCGMALMSTHPRDFDFIHRLSYYSITGSISGNVSGSIATDFDSSSSSSDIEHHNQIEEHQPQQQQLHHQQEEHRLPFRIIPAFGVHPWFIHELTDEDWLPMTEGNVTSTIEHSGDRPRWTYEIECFLRNNPTAIVGEIGLDRFHFTVTDDATGTTNNSNNTNTNTKELTTPIQQQIKVFQAQVELAMRYQRPVCIHCVQAFGSLFDVLAEIKNTHHQTLPNKIYFHAYGGKLNTIAQLISFCEGKTPKTKQETSSTTTRTTSRHCTKCYFGFAPVVNSRSHKTPDIIRAIGLSRLLLETDLEDVTLVSQSLKDGIQYIAEALGIDETTVIEQTTKNAIEFYHLTE
jgi:Tat protein secretion system quality control protein TatD with DNase activity